MSRRALFALIKCAVALTVLGGLAALAYLFRGSLGGVPGAGESDEEPAKQRRVQNNVVKLGARLAASFGLQDTPARVADWQPRITVYGRVVPNPSATAEVRAPFAGTLRVQAGAWPKLGSQVQADKVLAWLDIRVGPEVRLDLLTKLHDARARLEGAQKNVKIQQEAVDRFKNVGGSLSVADRETAKVKLNEEKMRLASAEASLAEWKNALDEIDRQGDRQDTIWRYPLKAPVAGEVTELTAGPNTVVAADSPILRVVDFHQVLVRLDVPLSALASGPPHEVQLSAVTALHPALEGTGHRPEPAPPSPLVPAIWTGVVPQIDPTSQTAGFWYEVNRSAAPPATTAAPGGVALGAAGLEAWRPGLFVKAEVEVAGAKRVHAVAVPETAVLYHQGRALVYVTLSPGRYERREVQVLGRVGDRWFLAGGVTNRELVVSQRAQVLLSEEFRGEADND